MAKHGPESLYGLELAELSGRVGSEHAARVFDDLYKRRLRSSQSIDTALRQLGMSSVAALRRGHVTSGSMTAKFLFHLEDGGAIESVRIQRRTGQTACVSSQVGCAFGCTFCASGRLGLKRSLNAGEIVQQVLELGDRINRVVYMGIGEPLNNYGNVMKSIRILRERQGLALKTSGITISTIGIPKALDKLREEHLRINLTVSLHATTDSQRHQLIPGATNHSVMEVIESSQRWAERHNRVVTYVYLILPGINDSQRDQQRLVSLLRGRRSRLNLMRWNPVEGGPAFRRVDDKTLTRFKNYLESRGLDVVVRDTQGKDIDAACGQLWLREITEERAKRRG